LETSTEVWVKSIRHAGEVIFVLKIQRNFVLGVPSPVTLEMAGPRDPKFRGLHSKVYSPPSPPIVSCISGSIITLSLTMEFYWSDINLLRK
jgi:hypothetical protein